MLDHRVTTPENVDFRFTLAGPGTRLAAWLVDAGIVAMLLLFSGAAIAVIAPGGYAEAGLAINAFVVVTAYWIAFEHRWRGRTPGKRLFGLRVVGERGLPLDLGRIVLRNLLRPVDLLPGFGGVAAVFMGLHPQHRRLGDLVAGTIVVRERRVPPPERLRSVFGAGRAVQRVLPVDARRRLSADEREFLLDLCLRRDALDEEVRGALFREVAAGLRATLGPIGSGAGLSEEKLVLLATAELYEAG